MKLLLSKPVRDKLAWKKPPVTLKEIRECFASREYTYLEDRREQNQTIPPTWWFIADTDRGRALKVVFVRLENSDIAIKTAYDPNPEEIRIYTQYAKAIT